MRKKILYIKENWQNETSLPFFVATFLYTLGFIVTLVIDFFTTSLRTPQWALIIYGTLLSAYVFSKEFTDRWILKIKWVRRKGDLFVYIWIGLSFAMYLGEYASNGKYRAPPMIADIVATVICLYLFSITSKYLYNRKSRLENRNLYRDWEEETYPQASILFKQNQIKQNKKRKEGKGI